MSSSPRLLVIGYGNPSRGDDALGPALLHWLQGLHQDRPFPGDIAFFEDFQLQIEHAADLLGRDLALFLDADTTCPPPCRLAAVPPAEEVGYTTHVMSPGQVLRVFEQSYRRPPPPAFVLAVRGERFGLGESLSAAARRNLDQARRLARELLEHPDPAVWSLHTVAGETNDR